MSIDYTIKAYPTIYRERLYRSRLEARWAAFFDLLKWSSEYEPFDLGEWSPDFLIRGARECLIEVKPITGFDEPTGDKMIKAAQTHRPDANLLLVGINPILSPLGIRLGHWSSFVNGKPLDWWTVYLVMIPGSNIADIMVLRSGLTLCLLSGLRDKMNGDEMPRLNDTEFGASELMGLWNAATNAVQWKAPNA